MSIRAGQSLGGYRGDVLGVDERLGAVSRRYRDNAVDGLEEGFAEVLHEPSGTQDGMGDDAAADQVELDGSQGDLRRGLVDAIDAQIRDVTHASGLRKIEEGRYLVSEVHSHDRRDQIEAIEPCKAARWGVASSQSQWTSAPLRA